MAHTYPISSLTLRLATPEQTLQTRKNTTPMWGLPNGFTEESYLLREEIMDRQEWSRNGGFTTWVLVTRDDPLSTERILSHCETYRRRAYLLPPTSSSQPSPVHSIVSYGIASVWTPPAFRSKGYAMNMLQRLHYKLAMPDTVPAWPVEEWGDDDGVGPGEEGKGFRDAFFSVLYSDIGPSYYSKATQSIGTQAQPGWVSQSPPTYIWTLDPSLQRAQCDQKGWRWLDFTGVRSLQEILADDMEALLPSLGDKRKTRVAVAIKDGLLSLHAMRDALSPVTQALPAPHTYGLTLPHSSSSASGPAPFVSYCFQGSVTATPTLHVCYVRGDVPFEAVLEAARREKCQKIEVWGDAGAKWAKWAAEGSAGGIELQMLPDGLEEHIPCLAVYSKEIEDVEFLFNERYVWC